MQTHTLTHARMSLHNGHDFLLVIHWAWSIAHILSLNLLEKA